MAQAAGESRELSTGSRRPAGRLGSAAAPSAALLAGRGGCQLLLHRRQALLQRPQLQTRQMRQWGCAAEPCPASPSSCPLLQHGLSAGCSSSPPCAAALARACPSWGAGGTAPRAAPAAWQPAAGTGQAPACPGGQRGWGQADGSTPEQVLPGSSQLPKGARPGQGLPGCGTHLLTPHGDVAGVSAAAGGHGGAALGLRGLVLPLLCRDASLASGQPAGAGGTQRVPRVPCMGGAGAGAAAALGRPAGDGRAVGELW